MAVARMSAAIAIESGTEHILSNLGLMGTGAWAGPAGGLSGERPFRYSQDLTDCSHLHPVNNQVAFGDAEEAGIAGEGGASVLAHHSHLEPLSWLDQYSTQTLIARS